MQSEAPYGISRRGKEAAHKGQERSRRDTKEMLRVKPHYNVRVKLGTGQIRFGRVVTVVDQDNITVKVGKNTPTFTAVRDPNYKGHGFMFIQESVAFALTDISYRSTQTETDDDTSVILDARMVNSGLSTVSDIEQRLDGGSWESVEGYSFDDPGWGFLEIAGLDYDTDYSAEFRIVNAEGNGQASTAFVIHAPSTVPAAPESLVVTPGDEELSVAFDAGWSGGNDISDYEYRIKPAWNGAEWDDWTTGATDVSPVVITGLINGLVYDVQLRAQNDNGAGAESEEASGTPSA